VVAIDGRLVALEVEVEAIYSSFGDVVGRDAERFEFVAERVEAGETMRYQPDYTRLLFKEIRTLIEENTREELRNELAAITEEIEAWQANYDVETWEELEQSLADGDLSSDELREHCYIIGRWEENQEDRRLIKHALALYSNVEAARDQMIDVADRAAN
jgi:hypothetical protein